MMAQKRLRELLQEDQEPFLLKNYIADRRCELKGPSSRTHLQVIRKRKPPISHASNFPRNFCRNACFLSFNNNSPDPRKSPLFDFQSPVKSPCRSTPNTILLHVPARTATLLLEAALRIQKQSSSPKTKNNGVGLFGSVLKRLTHRTKSRQREINGDGAKVSMKDIPRWDSSVGRKKSANERDSNRVQEIVIGVNYNNAFETGSSCSCNDRPCSAAWPESNEEKSLDLETSSSSHSEEDILAGNVNFVKKAIDHDHHHDDTDFASYDAHFCESPCHLVLQSTLPSGDRTPEFPSPARSPRHHIIEGDDVESSREFQVRQKEGEEEDKEQSSPVSVLDAPFEDDDDGHDDEVEDDGFDCSYAIVQRTKQLLLQKLCRFEKLAGLDPVELEKRMIEQEQGGDGDIYDIDDSEEEEEYEIDVFGSSDREINVDNFIIEELSESSFCRPKEISRDLRKLVTDLIDEEERKQNFFTNKEATMRRVCKKLESWKEVESNTIDMMVHDDFKREHEEWKRNQGQVGDAAMEIEIGIFGLLVDELNLELLGFNEDF